MICVFIIFDKIYLMKYYYLIIFFIFSQTLYSQITGYVFDSENKPISNVDVYFSDQDILLKTNDSGIFFLENDLPQNSYVHFFKQGFASKLIIFDKDSELKFILKKLHVTIDEIGVSETYSELGNVKLTNIEKKSINDVFLNGNSMVESITELSGVDMISSGLGIQKVVVRGLSGMRVVSYLNGMQINNQQWANDHGIGFTDLGLGEVHLIKGSSALKYGAEAIGGLLYFKDEPFISNNKLKGYFATKFNNSNYLSSSKFGLKWNKKNLFINVHAQYSIATDYRLPDLDDDDQTSAFLYNSRFKQNAIKFSLSYRYKKLQHTFRYQLHNESPGIPGHVHGDPSLTNPNDLYSDYLDLNEDFKLARPNQIVNNQLFIYEADYFLKNIKFNLYAGHFINNLQEWEKWTRPAFDINSSNTLITPSIRINSKDFVINFGSQISYLDNLNKMDDRLVPDASSFNLGHFFIVEYEKNNFGFNSGIRYDYKKLQSNDDFLNIGYSNYFKSTSSSCGLYYSLNDHIFRLSYSGAYRAPHFSELFSNGVHHGTNRFEIGNQDLEIEKANQYDFKYQWSNDHLGFVINVFNQDISNFISITPTNENRSGYKVYNYIQYDNVTLKGVEMNLHYHPHVLHDLHLEQSYSFLKSENQDDNYGLALTPANSIKSKVKYDFSQSEKLAKFKLSYFSFYHIYKFQQNSFAEYEEITEGYSLIHLKLGLKFNKNFKASIGVNNLLDEIYTPHISRIRGVAGGIPHPGRSYNISLKYEF